MPPISSANLDYNDPVQTLLREAMAQEMYLTIDQAIKEAPQMYNKYGFHGFAVGAGALMHFDQFRDGNRSLHDIDLEAVGNSTCPAKLADPQMRDEYRADIRDLFQKAAHAAGFGFAEYKKEALPARQQKAMELKGKEKLYFDVSRSFTRDDIAQLLTRRHRLRDEDVDYITKHLPTDDAKINVHLQVEVLPFYTNPLLHPRSRVGKEVFYAKDDKIKGVSGLMQADHRVSFASRLLRCLEGTEKRKATDLMDLNNMVQRSKVMLSDPIVRKLFIAMMVIYDADPAKLDIAHLKNPSPEAVDAAMDDLKARTPATHDIDAQKVKWLMEGTGGILEGLVGLKKEGGQYTLDLTPNEQQFLDLWFKGSQRGGGNTAIHRCDAELLFSDIKGHPKFEGYDYLIDNINKHPLVVNSPRLLGNTASVV